MTWSALREWLRTPMEVSYAQVLGNGLVLLAVLCIAATLALWVYELGRQVKNGRAIERHLSETVERLDNELHCCKRALGRR